MTPVSTIITCQHRKAELENTRSQLTKLGIHPLVISMPCDPPSIEGNLWGAYVAVRHAWGYDTGLLFMEDDIDTSPDLPRFLEMAIEADALTTFIVFRNTLYNNPTLGRRHDTAKPSLVRLDDSLVKARRGFHGSQALYLPPKAVRLALSERERFVTEGLGFLPAAPKGERRGFDFWVKEKAEQLGGLYAAWPNPVQHRNSAPSTFSGRVGNFVSASYGTPVDWG